MDKDIILQTENLKKYFRIRRGQEVKAVDGVSIQVERGKTLGLVGESGCGKSTLGRTLIRIYDPTDGKILLNGKPAKPSAAVKPGDVVEVLYASGSLKFRVLDVRETVKKDEAASLYEVLS